ncbi:MAG TPA: tetratricopeptide repeat protein [Pyrinomonadaceae bacterium]|nr:tetratricopeptide repeat protein [Pyrinomonadaceae bacterium]
MTEQIKIIETKDWKGRLGLGVLIIAALVFAWFSISWQLGNMLAALTPSNAPNARAIAGFAYTLSPRDPITNWFKANVEKDDFIIEEQTNSVADLEQTVRYAPEDYRYWLELGRACEQIENYEKAEKAFQRAVKIAPEYSNVHWHLGNYYLRRGQETEAFPALRKSAETSAVYREQVFSVVWDYFEKDKVKLEQLAGDKPDMRAGLAKFYAAKELPEDSLRIWNTLSDEDKTRNQDIARLIAQALYDKRFYRSSIEFVRQLGIETQVQAETVQNGGFELPIAAEAKEAYFGWQITRKEKIEVNTDPVRKKEGNKSLRVSFNGFTGIEVKNILQIVAVESNKKYRLSFWLKTENLKSAGTPTLEILNANDEKLITTSAAFPSGTQDWSPVTLEFTVPPAAEAVALRFDRAYCGDACPLIGTFWVDDFKLEKIN